MQALMTRMLGVRGSMAVIDAECTHRARFRSLLSGSYPSWI